MLMVNHIKFLQLISTIQDEKESPFHKRVIHKLAQKNPFHRPVYDQMVAIIRDLEELEHKLESKEESIEEVIIKFRRLSVSGRGRSLTPSPRMVTDRSSTPSPREGSEGSRDESPKKKRSGSRPETPNIPLLATEDVGRTTPEKATHRNSQGSGSPHSGSRIRVTTPRSSPHTPTTPQGEAPTFTPMKDSHRARRASSSSPAPLPNQHPMELDTKEKEEKGDNVEGILFLEVKK